MKAPPRGVSTRKLYVYDASVCRYQAFVEHVKASLGNWFERFLLYESLSHFPGSYVFKARLLGIRNTVGSSYKKTTKKNFKSEEPCYVF